MRHKGKLHKACYSVVIFIQSSDSAEVGNVSHDLAVSIVRHSGTLCPYTPEASNHIDGCTAYHSHCVVSLCDNIAGSIYRGSADAQQATSQARQKGFVASAQLPEDLHKNFWTRSKNIAECACFVSNCLGVPIASMTGPTPLR